MKVKKYLPKTNVVDEGINGYFSEENQSLNVLRRKKKDRVELSEQERRRKTVTGRRNIGEAKKRRGKGSLNYSTTFVVGQNRK